MNNYLKNIIFSITLFLLPSAKFIHSNIKLIDLSILTSLAKINLLSLLVIFSFSFIIFFSFKKIKIYEILIYLFVIYNILFYYNDIKILLLA